ncbi:MAG TPA: hypothetical protein VFM88_21065 [Vicinamibacteria bacterium]|nr:hypothetical protein [Vicinamibacteria bacterium]
MRAALALLLAAGAASAQEASSVALVRLADGSELPLASWRLVYEHQTWNEGSSPAFADIKRREGRELIAGKKLLAVAGGRLELQHRVYEKTDEQGQKVPGAAVAALVLTVGGKKTTLKPEAPPKEMLAGDAKKVFYQARVLDLVGETLTGTKRELCLVSFSPLVECSALPADRVVSVEFP